MNKKISIKVTEAELTAILNGLHQEIDGTAQEVVIQQTMKTWRMAYLEMVTKLENRLSAKLWASVKPAT